MIPVIVILAAAAVFMAVVLTAANKIFDVAVNAGKTKEKVLKTNANKNADGTPKERSEKERANEWLRAQEPAVCRMRSCDGLVLAAHTLPAAQPSHLWAFCIHGFSGSGLPSRWA